MAYETILGRHAVTAALKQRDDLSQAILYLSNNQPKQKQQASRDLAQSKHCRIEVVSNKELDHLSQSRQHQGMVLQLPEGASDQSSTQTLTEHDLLSLVEKAGQDALVLVLDGVQDPHNLGACLRSADGAGVTAVVIPKDKSCSMTPVVRKVASGAAETVAVVTVTNIARTLQDLQSAGCWVVGLAGEAEQSLYEVDLRGPQVVVMGAEGDGMRRLTKERCDFLAKLPMAGYVSSLNVSVAAGIVLYEAVRQRQFPTKG